MLDAEEVLNADDWATEKPEGTILSREALRLKLARDMAAFEKINGPIITLPVTTCDKSSKRLRRALGDFEQVKRNPDGSLRPAKLTALQAKGIKAVRKGHNTTKAIAKYCGVSEANMRFTLGRLVRNGRLERLADDTYQEVKL